MHAKLFEKLQCPNCGADKSQGLDVFNAKCNACERVFFDLQGLPCWYTSGIGQREYWNHLLALFSEELAEEKTALEEQLSLPGLSKATKERLQNDFQVRINNQETIVNILKKAGLQNKKNEQFKDKDTKGFSMYQHLLLRDWAWREGLVGAEGYRSYLNENQIALENLVSLLPKDKQDFQGADVLFIGSGAGRLSLDFNEAIKAGLTVSLDNNPLLTVSAKNIVKNNSEIVLSESRLSPHKELIDCEQWSLKCPEMEESAKENWQPFCADAWSLPFKENCFDIVVTQWFLDINGRDVKELIALIDKLLVPGGLWLNLGPLLYPDDLSPNCHYTPSEIREFLTLSEFTLKQDKFFVGPYCHSPLSEKGRLEEVWGFAAQTAVERGKLEDVGESAETFYKNAPPCWYVMPHLPVPKFSQEDLFPEELMNLAMVFDGTRSINEIVELLAPNLPEGQDARSFVYDFLDQFVLK